MAGGARRTVEDEQQPSTLKHEHLVPLVLERDVSLRSAQPLVLGLEVVHRLVKVVEVPVSEELVVDEVELTTGVHERVAVAFSGEVHPPAQRFGKLLLIRNRDAADSLGVSELVSFKVQVPFTSESVNDKPKIGVYR